MRKIPEKIRNEIERDSFYRKCISCSSVLNINIHHVLIGNRQRDEKCFLVPLCFDCHEKANTKKMIDLCEFVAFNRAPKGLLRKLGLESKKERLNERFK